MPVQTSTRPLGTAGRDDYQGDRLHQRSTCPCCRRAEALANAHVEDVVALEWALDEAMDNCRAYRELLTLTLGQFRRQTIAYRRTAHQLHRLLSNEDEPAEELVV